MPAISVRVVKRRGYRSRRVSRFCDRTVWCPFVGGSWVASCAGGEPQRSLWVCGWRYDGLNINGGRQMTGRWDTLGTLTIGLVAWASGMVMAQPVVSEGWTPDRTSDGRPDLQGIWANNRATPMERPEQLGTKATLTDEELAELASQIAAFRNTEQAGDLLGDRLIQQALGNAEFQDFDTVTGNYNAFWLVDRELDSRTSLIISPEDGRRPAQTATAQARAREATASRGGPSDGPEDRTLGDRCLHFAVPNMGSGYNSYFQLFQTPTQVTIMQEMGHLVRTIPLDGRSHLDDRIAQWAGNARGHWDGDTLVVETRNYDARSRYSGGSANLVIVERFTRISPTVLRQEITLTDPDTWTEPWTVELLLDQSADAIFEYACHEGNYAMAGILGGARAEERAATAER